MANCLLGIDYGTGGAKACIINDQGEPILIDFGAARESTNERVTRMLSALRVVKDGYSPQEFYIAGSEQTPSCDLYSLAASFYHIITRELPPDSQWRRCIEKSNRPGPLRKSNWSRRTRVLSPRPSGPLSHRWPGLSQMAQPHRRLQGPCPLQLPRQRPRIRHNRNRRNWPRGEDRLWPRLLDLPTHRRPLMQSPIRCWRLIPEKVIIEMLLTL